MTAPQEMSREELEEALERMRERVTRYSLALVGIARALDHVHPADWWTPESLTEEVQRLVVAVQRLSQGRSPF